LIAASNSASSQYESSRRGVIQNKGIDAPAHLKFLSHVLAAFELRTRVQHDCSRERYSVQVGDEQVEQLDALLDHLCRGNVRRHAERHRPRLDAAPEDVEWDPCRLVDRDKAANRRDDAHCIPAFQTRYALVNHFLTPFAGPNARNCLEGQLNVILAQPMQLGLDSSAVLAGDHKELVGQRLVPGRKAGRGLDSDFSRHFSRWLRPQDLRCLEDERRLQEKGHAQEVVMINVGGPQPLQVLPASLGEIGRDPGFDERRVEPDSEDWTAFSALSSSSAVPLICCRTRSRSAPGKKKLLVRRNFRIDGKEGRFVGSAASAPQ
jgi:hypothetical protein